MRGFGVLCRTPDTSTAKMMQCFHFLVEPVKTLTSKIKVFESKTAHFLFLSLLVESRPTRPASAGSLRAKEEYFLLCCRNYDVNFWSDWPPSSIAQQHLCNWSQHNCAFLTSGHIIPGAAQIQEGEGASGRGSTVCCRVGSRPRSSLPGAAWLPVPKLPKYKKKIPPLWPTCGCLLRRCCRGQKSWRTSGSRMTSGPLLFARPFSCSGPLYWRARCFWGDSVWKK